MKIKLLILNLIVNIIAKAVVFNPVAVKPVAVKPVAVKPAVLNLQSKIKACKNINGTFNTKTGVCDQSVASSTCNGSAVNGDFNTATGSCNSQQLGNACTDSKGVFSYNYNSNNTAITTSCDQSAAIKACTKINGTFGPLWPATNGVCDQRVALFTCAGNFNTDTGSCVGIESYACTGSKDVFSYKYNSDYTAIITSCDQSKTIADCSKKNGIFGPLFPDYGFCDQSAAENACPLNCKFNSSNGSCNCSAAIADCLKSTPGLVCQFNSSNGSCNCDYNN